VSFASHCYASPHTGTKNGNAGDDRGAVESIQSNRALEVTLQKLIYLEQLYAKTLASPAENDYVRGLTLRSLRRTINQLKEEITRFEMRTSTSDTEEK
jgi:hypothetical protein